MNRGGARALGRSVAVAAGITWTLALASCHRPPPHGLAQVVQLVPSTEEAGADDLKDGIRVSFDRAAAPADVVGRVLAGPAFVIAPALPGVARWMDARTLAYFPAAPPRVGQAYQISLDEHLALAAGTGLGAWKGARLVYDRIRIEQMTLIGLREFQPPKPLVIIRASQPVGAAAASACGFFERKGDGGDVGARTGAVAVPLPEPPPGSDRDSSGGAEDADLAAGRLLRVTPAEALRPATSYLIRCGGDFRALAGGEGLGKERDEVFMTYGAPGIKSIEPAARSEIPADHVTVKIEFATPMPPAQVRKHLRLVARGKSPPVVQFDGDYRETVFRWSGDLEPQTDYDLEIADGMVDRHGQKLAPVKVHSFRVGDASARLSVATGAFVVERPAGRFPLATRNLEQFQVRCAPVPEARLAGVMTTALLHESSWEGDKRSPLDWAKLGLTDRSSTVRPQGPRNRWHEGGVDLGPTCAEGKAAGLYLLEFGTDEERNDEGKVKARQRRALANVTDLGLLAKIGTASSLIWVVRLSTGKPVAGAQIKIRDLKGTVHFAGTSNADGVALAPAAARLVAASAAAPAADRSGGDQGPAESDEPGDQDTEDGFDPHPNRVLVTAQAGDDLAVLDTAWTRGLEAWNFDMNQERDGRELRIRGFIHSDRGLYRPGETVHLRGLVRSIDHAGRMTVPKRRKVHLVLEDPRGTALLETDLAVSAYGGFHHDVVVDSEARLGDYQVKVTADSFVVREHFSVEEFRARTFEVAVKTAHRNVFLGHKLTFDLAATYLHGSPLRAGTVKWSLRRRPHRPHFADFDGFVFQDFVAQADAGQWWARSEDRSFSDPVADGEAAIDAQGKARVSARDELHGAPAPQDYLFEANVEDPSGQAVSADQVVTGHRANLYLGLAPAEYVQRAQVAFPIKVVGFDAEGKRRAATAKLSLTRRSYACGPSPDTGSWRCERKEDLTPATVVDVVIAAQGEPATVNVVVPDSGEYVARIEGPDGRGQQAVASDFIYVIGKLAPSWNDEEGARMKLIASKARYQPGDVARLVPQTQLPGALALVTLERDGIMSYALKPLGDSGEAIEIPIDARAAPNLLASVALVRGRRDPSDKGRPAFKMGMINLEVDGAAKRLAVTVETERPSYRPGERVVARVRVKAADGKPARSELAIAAADEGVLQILGYKTPDPLPAFYAPWGLGVETATNWNRIVERPDPLREGGEEGGDAGGSEAGRVRSRFMATAFWAPAVVSRPDGSAEVSFTAPDNLTAYRIMAVAADSGDRFGSGEVRFTVRKPLQIVPALPRFFTEGDTAQAGALVHNNSDAALEVKVQLAAEGVETPDAPSASLTVPAQGVRRVAFVVLAKHEGEAHFRFRVSGGSEQDAVDTTVPVRRSVVGETIVLGEGDKTGRVELPLPALGTALPGRGSLDLVFDRTGLGRLDEGFGYLVGYPYGCLEQLTSKVVPMVALSELAAAGPVAGIKSAEMAPLVRAGVAKILRHQSDGGGFGLWLGTQPEVHYTAYALWGLHIAQQGGFVIPAAAIAEGARYLKGQLGDKPASGKSPEQVAGETGARAFAHAVLAELGQADAGALAQLFELRAQLPVYGRAFLLMGLGKVGRKDLAEQLIGEIGALAPGGDGPVVLKENARDLDWYWSSDVRTTALVLLALEQTARAHPLAARLGEGLLGARIDGRWASTQENVYGLLALAALARDRAASGSSSVRITLAGRERATRVLTGRGIERLSLPLGEIGPGPLALEISGGSLSYSARLRVERPLGAGASDRGLTVRREFLDPDTGAPLAKVKLGQAVRVRLFITAPGRQAHVAVVDRLPAGLEPIITRFRPTVAPVADDDEPFRALWWNNWQTAWQHEELRDDRTLIFADTLAPGESKHDYLARATSAGSFAVPGATAELMYRPAINGRSAASTLVIEAPAR